MKYLIIKEIKSAIYNQRFITCIFGSFIFLPLSIYISLNDYKIKLNNYQLSENTYIDNSKGNIGPDFIAKGFYLPSEYAFISRGIENSLPNSVEISPNKIKYGRDIDVKSFFLLSVDKIDYKFILLFFFSLMIIFLSFDMISSEKESGTLTLLISNQISRSKIFISKILSVLLMVVISIFISLIVTILLIKYDGFINIISKEFIFRMLILFIVIIIFVILITVMSVFVSVISKKSDVSISICLLIWLIFTILIPKLSPMVARVVYPIKSVNEVNKEIELINKNYDSKLYRIEKNISEKIFSSEGLKPWEVFNLNQPQNKEIKRKMDNSLKTIRLEYEKNREFIINKTLMDHHKKENTQNEIAKNISLISPICCFGVIVSEISNTGYGEKANFYAKINDFKSEVEENVYNKWEFKRYIVEGCEQYGNVLREGVNYKSISTPLMKYEHLKIQEIFVNILKEVIVMTLYILLFLSLGYFSFSKLVINKY